MPGEGPEEPPRSSGYAHPEHLARLVCERWPRTPPAREAPAGPDAAVATAGRPHRRNASRPGVDALEGRSWS
jgi:hypothetical protein